MKIPSYLNVVGGGGGKGLIIAHKWRLRVKGELFSGFRYVKG